MAISEYLGLEMAEIYGVITFYSRFTLKPKGKYNIAICLGTACYVKGSEKILDRVKERLKIDVGETTPDGKISLCSEQNKYLFALFWVLLLLLLLFGWFYFVLL